MRSSCTRRGRLSNATNNSPHLNIDELKNALIDYHIYGEGVEKAMDDAKAYSKQEDWNN
jgi:hypothetical protein